MRYLVIVRRTWLSSPASTYDHQLIEVVSNHNAIRQDIIDTLAAVPIFDRDIALNKSLVQVLPLPLELSL